ncbi:peptidoglycan editing factor PgeF [Shewanella chilikensis]|uniref:peptidoglycan editing factor PgeF n=1 Tax=Shewanella chilikensis TaxID=558541 RepID=UPI001F26564D|nr:peptidoglycan editing factor PgeF [Shewanella chilikensis]MCE9788299.1 peptidoglycan editing factor PgeF [Shewanella chilikensis]
MYDCHWPLPVNVRIAMTQRHGGVSLPPFDSLNLGLHVGDISASVQANRALLAKRLALPSEPAWLEQVHGTEVVDLARDSQRVADGSYSDSKAHVAVVMTADCLPVLLCDSAGTQVAALHAGWRGLCDGVIEAGIACFRPGSELIACLGPAIGKTAFEVGTEVRAAFCDKDPKADNCFVAKGDKFLGDLQGLARLRLQQAGVRQVYALDACTYSNKDYFSYRRDGRTGRMASLIWLTD